MLNTSESGSCVGADVMGRSIDDLDTPTPLIDLDLFEQNAGRIGSFLSAHGLSWRPHTKAHKSPFLARLQLAAGAEGVTCAKIGEAEVMAAAGITNILVANELGTPRKWQRVAALQRQARVLVCVDAEVHVRWASQAAAAQGVTLPLLVEIDVGMGRTGVGSVGQALELAEHIRAAAGVELAGIMGYEGHLLTIGPREQKARRCRSDLEILRITADALRDEGHRVDIVSAGGTGTFEEMAGIDWLTECQAGGGCLMDRFYAEECHVDLAFALTLLATVVSARDGHAVVDAGYKALGGLAGLPLPRPVDGSGVEFVGLSAEHGSIRMNDDPVHVGDRIQVIPGYSDAMLFLHNFVVGHRHGIVTDVIPLEGRGCLT